MAYVVLPNSGQTLGKTRAQINTNFSLIQSVFDKNHYDYNDAFGNEGKHTKIQLPEQTVFPLTPVNEGQLLAREYNTKTQLAWRPENTLATGDQYMLSAMPIRAAARFNGNGALGAKTPEGLSFNVTISKSSASNYTVTFVSKFGTVPATGSNDYLVLAQAGSGTINVFSQSDTSFNLLTSSVTPGIISFVVLGGDAVI